MIIECIRKPKKCLFSVCFKTNNKQTFFWNVVFRHVYSHEEWRKNVCLASHRQKKEKKRYQDTDEGRNLELKPHARREPSQPFRKLILPLPPLPPLPPLTFV